MKKPKKTKPNQWNNRSVQEERVLVWLERAFGKLTFVDLANYVWVPYAKTRRCPECESWWKASEYPRCGWCGYRE